MYLSEPVYLLGWFNHFTAYCYCCSCCVEAKLNDWGIDFGFQNVSKKNYIFVFEFAAYLRVFLLCFYRFRFRLCRQLYVDKIVSLG